MQILPVAESGFQYRFQIQYLRACRSGNLEQVGAAAQCSISHGFHHSQHGDTLQFLIVTEGILANAVDMFWYHHVSQAAALKTGFGNHVDGVGESQFFQISIGKGCVANLPDRVGDIDAVQLSSEDIAEIYKIAAKASL